MAEAYLTDLQLGTRFGVHRATIWRWTKGRNGFPMPVALSPGCSRWRQSEIETWERAKAAGTSAA